MILEQLERQVLADRQGLIARGVGKDLPFFPTERDALMERLAAEPVTVTQVDSEEQQLRRALKVA
jgi:hypothetical protein